MRLFVRRKINCPLSSGKSLKRNGHRATVNRQTVPHKRTSDREVACAEYSLGSWNNEILTVSRPNGPSIRHSDRHAVGVPVRPIWHFYHWAYKSLRLSKHIHPHGGSQDIHSCLSFVGWHRSCVPSWRMYAGYRRWPPSSVVCWQSNVLGQEITQPVRWPLFCHRRANTVEQSVWTASATGHHLRTIQTIVGNDYVWLVGPRRPVSKR